MTERKKEILSTFLATMRINFGGYHVDNVYNICHHEKIGCPFIQFSKEVRKEIPNTQRHPHCYCAHSRMENEIQGSPTLLGQE